MPGSRKPGPSVKDDELYEKLRGEGESKEESARIANASADSGHHAVGKKGGRLRPTTSGPRRTSSGEPGNWASKADRRCRNPTWSTHSATTEAGSATAPTLREIDRRGFDVRSGFSLSDLAESASPKRATSTYLDTDDGFSGFGPVGGSILKGFGPGSALILGPNW